MDISVNQLLKKMDKELEKAKLAEGSSKLRESIHSIKILCELILEENEVDSRLSQAVVTTLPKTSQVVSTTTSLTSRKLEMEDEANGDSLFDF